MLRYIYCDGQHADCIALPLSPRGLELPWHSIRRECGLGAGDRPTGLRTRLALGRHTAGWPPMS